MNPQHRYVFFRLFLTHDARQRCVAEERDAIMMRRVAHFIHVGRLRHSELAESFVLAAPRILRFRDRYPPPFIAKVHRPERKTPYRITPGAITMVLTHQQWMADRKR